MFKKVFFIILFFVFSASQANSAEVVADMVSETTSTTGTGTISLAGARPGYRTFVAGIGTGNQCTYQIKGSAGEWEIGIGTVTDATPDTLSRTTVYSSSNGGSKVVFSAGFKTVTVVLAENQISEFLAGMDATPNGIVSGLRISDAGGLGISWSAGVVLINGGKQAINAGTATVTDDYYSFVYATEGSATLTVIDANAFPAGEFAMVGMIYAVSGAIGTIWNNPILSESAMLMETGATTNNAATWWGSKNGILSNLSAKGTQSAFTIMANCPDLGDTDYQSYQKQGLMISVKDYHDRQMSPLGPVNDVVGADIRGYMGVGNMQGRIWSMYNWAEIPEGADGAMVGQEMGLRNNGCPSPLLAEHTTKQGLCIFAMGNPVAAGIALRQASLSPFGAGSFYEGIHIDQQGIVAALPFTSGGTTAIAEGNTITGATSSVTAKVDQIYITSGTWGGGDAAGTIYIKDESGSFTPGEELNVGAATGLATATSDAVDGYALRLQRFSNTPEIVPNKDYFRLRRDGAIFTEGKIDITGTSQHLWLTGGGNVLLNNGSGVSIKNTSGAARIILTSNATDDVVIGSPTTAPGGSDLVLMCNGSEAGRIDTTAKNLTLTNKLAFTGGGKFNLLDATKTENFTSVAAATTLTTTQTVTGAALGDYVNVAITDRSGWDAGLLVNGYVSSTDTVTLAVTNTTAAAIDPAEKTFNIRVMTR